MTAIVQNTYSYSTGCIALLCIEDLLKNLIRELNISFLRSFLSHSFIAKMEGINKLTYYIFSISLVSQSKRVRSELRN